MSRLVELYEREGQSPWLDNLKRSWISSGELADWVRRGVRGITSNPTIFQKAIESGEGYDEQFASLVAAGRPMVECYWELVGSDIRDALAVLRPTYDASDGLDGYVSVEVAPSLARDTEGTVQAARHLHETIDEPNLYVKIPGTAEALPAIRQMIAEGRSVNVTLLFSTARYAEVIDAYLDGLEACEGDLSRVSSVASFFVSRVDSAVDAELDAIGTPEAAALRGRAAVANAQVAYQLFLDRFSGPRWDALVERGARVQRPLWASTSTKDPAYPDTLYVDSLIGPDTVNTIPDATLADFEDHGTVARTVDADPGAAAKVLAGLASLGVELDVVTERLEEEGVASFVASFDSLLASLGTRAADLT